MLRTICSKFASEGTILHERRGMQRFLRNPWRDEVPLMLRTPIAEPVLNWCAHLESMGLSAGGFTRITATYDYEECKSGRTILDAFVAIVHREPIGARAEVVTLFDQSLCVLRRTAGFFFPF